ncbi:MAG: hypothetical protein KGZ40_03515 [Clostridiales bacterium]|nr:hypothetical protein [Clostridiales bacterium]
MPDLNRIPEATVYRLSLYHCYLGELIRRGSADVRVTSRELAKELDIREETVRRDLSYVGGVGRPGAGYQLFVLFEALQQFLGLCDEYPIIRVGTAQMLQALQVVFPADAYGVRPVAYYSELPEDVGTVVGGIEVRHVTEIPRLDVSLEVRVALVACSPGWIDPVLEMLNEADVTGVLLLTPKVKLDRPERMNVRHIRMPCDIKSLAHGCRIPSAVGV